jgi:lambda family phage portal protein
MRWPWKKKPEVKAVIGANTQQAWRPGKGYSPNAKRFKATELTNLNWDWLAKAFKGNEKVSEKVKRELVLLRKQCRTLEEDSDLTRRYLSLCETNVVGRGFRLLLPDGGKRVETLFYNWLDKADVSNALFGADLQRHLIRTIARDGETFIQILRGPEFPDGVGISILDPDLIDEKYNDTSRNIQNGIEKDKYGKPISYYLVTPGDGRSRQKISAKDCIHIYRPIRIGQARGFPWMAGSIESLQMLAGYLEAELVSSRVASCKMGFYSVPPGDDFIGDSQTASGQPISEASPGVFERIPTGWNFQQFSPEHPTSQFGEFVKSVLRQIAGGLNVSYNSLANDLSDVSYSSARVALLDERESWIVIQDWFAKSALTPLFLEWLRTANISGVISIQEKQLAESNYKWVGKRWSWVSPEKDIEATQKEIQMGLKSPSQVCAEKGIDFAETQKQIAMDKATVDELNPANTGGGAVQDTALNGAQISSMVQVISAATAGQMPKESVGPILKAAFPSLSDEEISNITKPIEGFQATPGN